VAKESAGVRDRQKAETRARVLTAARALFLRDGFEQVTIKAIAEEAKVAVGSVFTTFRSKHELLDEIAIEDLRASNEEGAAIVSALPDEAVGDRIEAFALACLRRDLAKKALLGPTFAGSWMRTREAETRVAQAMAHSARIVHGVLKDAVAAGVLDARKDLRMAVEMILTLFFANYRRTVYADAEEAELLARLRAQLAVIVEGLRAQA
jgi:AcrR family transcriptional regulator